MKSPIAQVSVYKLEVFCLVAELSSVSRAAERLRIAQPVVSSHLRTLSVKVGAPLTTKSGRRLALTEEGRAVHRWARDIVARTRDFEREMSDRRDGLAGTAVVGASMTLGSYLLPGLIAEFHGLAPAGRISVRVSTPVLAIDAVETGDCDFAFTILDPRHEMRGLDVWRAGDEALLLVVAPDREPAVDELTIDALTDMPFVAAQAGTPRREIEEQVLIRHGVRRHRIAMELGHAEAIKRAVRAGVGAAFLFRSSVQDELASGALRLAEVPGLRLAVPIFRVLRRGQRLSPFQLSLMRFLEQGVEARGPGRQEFDAARG